MRSSGNDGTLDGESDRGCVMGVRGILAKRPGLAIPGRSADARRSAARSAWGPGGRPVTLRNAVRHWIPKLSNGGRSFRGGVGAGPSAVCPVRKPSNVRRPKGPQALPSMPAGPWFDGCDGGVASKFAVTRRPELEADGRKRRFRGMGGANFTAGQGEHAVCQGPGAWYSRFRHARRLEILGGSARGRPERRPGRRGSRASAMQGRCEAPARLQLQHGSPGPSRLRRSGNTGPCSAPISAWPIRPSS